MILNLSAEPDFDSVCGDRRNVSYNFSGYREFIIYQENQCLTQYLCLCRDKAEFIAASLQDALSAHDLDRVQIAIHEADQLKVDNADVQHAKHLLAILPKLRKALACGDWLAVGGLTREAEVLDLDVPEICAAREKFASSTKLFELQLTNAIQAGDEARLRAALGDLRALWCCE